MNGCFLIQRKINVVYIYPMIGSKWDKYAERFSRLYREFRPTIEHTLIVVSNGREPSKRAKEIFANLPVTWYVHDNSGYDIGAFQVVAAKFPATLMVCLGASTYFRKAGWLERMVEGAEKYGLGVYGSMGHQGHTAYRVWPHVRTSAFWLDPVLLNEYPMRIRGTGQRYEFEHGRSSICEWAKAMGFEVRVIGFKGDWPLATCNAMPNGYHKGDQSNCLTGDRLSEPPFYPHP